MNRCRKEQKPSQNYYGYKAAYLKDYIMRIGSW